MFCYAARDPRAQSIGRPKDALDLMNSQQLHYTKKMQKERRRVHELEEKDAQMRLAVHQRKQFLAKVRERRREGPPLPQTRALSTGGVFARRARPLVRREGE